MRIYLAANPEDLVNVRLDIDTAFAATDEVWKELAPLNPDEDTVSQYVLDLAADAALTRVSSGGVSRRVVIVAEVNSEHISQTSMSGLVHLESGIDWSDVVCFYVDEVDSSALVEAAQEGSVEAREELEGKALLWYDISERDGLAAEFSAS